MPAARAWSVRAVGGGATLPATEREAVLSLIVALHPAHAPFSGAGGIVEDAVAVARFPGVLAI
jgi:hypothetical protein